MAQDGQFVSDDQWQAYLDWLNSSQGSQEPNYTAWLPTNPGVYGAGNAGPSSYSWGESPWIPNVDNMPMEGGNFGYMAPLARRVAGASSLQDRVGGYLNNVGQPGGPQMMDPDVQRYGGPAILRADQDADWMANRSQGLINQMGLMQNKADQMYSGYTNPWQTDAVSKYNMGYGTANSMQSGWNPVSAGAAAAGALGQQNAAKRARPQDIMNDPGLMAEKEAFAQTTQPMMQNQFSLMGLGRSGGAGQAVANAWTQAAAPHVQAATQREVDRINRMTQSNFQNADLLANLANQRTQQQLGALQVGSQLAGQINEVGNTFDQRKFQAMNAANQAYQTQLAGFQPYQAAMQGNLAANEAWQNRGQQNFQREYDLMDRMMNYGNQFRGISQQANDAQYEDLLRRQGLSEQMLMAPMGMLQAGIGSQTSGGK